MDMYVVVLRLLQVFVLRREALRQEGAPPPKESLKLNGAIFRCMYQAVNCASDAVTSIVLPVLPLLPSLMDTQSNDNYFDVEKNAEVIRKIEQEIIAGKDVQLHYLRRIRILLPIFPEARRSLLLHTIMTSLKRLKESFAQAAAPIKESAMLTVSQMFEVVGALPLAVADFQDLFALVHAFLEVLSKKCPFLAHDRIIVRVWACCERRCSRWPTRATTTPRSSRTFCSLPARARRATPRCRSCRSRTSERFSSTWRCRATCTAPQQ